MAVGTWAAVDSNHWHYTAANGRPGWLSRQPHTDLWEAWTRRGHMRVVVAVSPHCAEAQRQLATYLGDLPTLPPPPCALPPGHAGMCSAEGGEG